MKEVEGRWSVDGQLGRYVTGGWNSKLCLGHNTQPNRADPEIPRWLAQGSLSVLQHHALIVRYFWILFTVYPISAVYFPSTFLRLALLGLNSSS